MKIRTSWGGVFGLGFLVFYLFFTQGNIGLILFFAIWLLIGSIIEYLEWGVDSKIKEFLDKDGKIN